MRIPEAVRTDRLVIRPFVEEDVDGYLGFMTDERAIRYLSLQPEQRTEAGARALFEFVRTSYETDHPAWVLAIEAPPHGFVGSCGVASVEGSILECRYSLLPRYWGHGYATEAAAALLGYVFDTSAVPEIRAYMSAESSRSSAVAARLGMEFPGPQAHPIFDRPGLLYVITREQWDRTLPGAGKKQA
jgi:ribosomal-protein-alanine N-acetyltransferase